MDVKYYFYTDYKFNTAQKANKFFDLLIEFGDVYLPQKYSEYEPIKHQFNVSDLTHPVDILSAPSRPEKGNILLKRDKPVDWLMEIHWNTFSPKLHRNYMVIEDGYFGKNENINRFLEFAREIFAEFELVYGSIGLEKEYDDKNVLQIEEQMGEFVAQVTRFCGSDISKRLPGIYWANFFGKRYVDCFGEKLETAAVFKKELLPNDGILILTSGSPLDYPKTSVVELQDNLKKHLGKKYFFDKGNPEGV